MSKWVLAEVISYDDYTHTMDFTDTMLDGETRVRFVRELRRRGSKQPRKDTITIAILSDGKTMLFRNFSLTSMKRERRQRMHALACQAIAYSRLMGTIEGFPEVDLL